MLTRGRKARVAVRPEAAHAALPPLPLPCVLDVLSRLAPGERLLSSAVSRAWRAAVSQPSLWASVDLFTASPHTASDALLAAIVSKVAGQLKSLRWCVGNPKGGVLTGAVLAFVTANAGNLRRLDMQNMPLTANNYFMQSLSKGEVVTLLHSAPGLLSFETDVNCTFQDAQALLAGQEKYNVVHIRRLYVERCSGEEVTKLTLLLPSLQLLGLTKTPLDTPAVLGALVDAAIAFGFTGLYIADCKLGPQSASHLSRLLHDAPRLSTLLIDSDHVFDAASAPVLALALRTSSLIFLQLEAVGLWQHDDVGSVLVDALVGHPTLQEISFAFNPTAFEFYPQNTVGHCWARLVTSNCASLHTLSFAHCDVGDDVLGPLFAALASNTTLRTVHLQGNGVSMPFARDVVLPSIFANNALRKIVLFDALFEEESIPELLEAEALVAARR